MASVTPEADLAKMMIYNEDCNPHPGRAREIKVKTLSLGERVFDSERWGSDDKPPT